LEGCIKVKTYFLFTTLLLLFGSQPLSCFAQGNISPDRQKDLQRQYQVARKAIKHESERLRINDLSNVTLTDEVETRLWVAFGEAYPRCLILKKSKTDNTAVYVKVTGVSGGVATTPEGGFIHQDKLGPPKTGWDALVNFITGQGVTSPIQLTLDSQHLTDPDEEFLVVEVKSGSVYSMVFFSLYTETADGRKALTVCHRVEEEFGVTMGCSTQK
jgi:hypothetical protein